MIAECNKIGIAYLTICYQLSGMRIATKGKGPRLCYTAVAVTLLLELKHKNVAH